MNLVRESRMRHETEESQSFNARLFRDNSGVWWVVAEYERDGSVARLEESDRSYPLMKHCYDLEVENALGLGFHEAN